MAGCVLRLRVDILKIYCKFSNRNFMQVIVLTFLFTYLYTDKSIIHENENCICIAFLTSNEILKLKILNHEPLCIIKHLWFMFICYGRCYYISVVVWYLGGISLLHAVKELTDKCN